MSVFYNYAWFYRPPVTPVLLYDAISAVGRTQIIYCSSAGEYSNVTERVHWRSVLCRTITMSAYVLILVIIPHSNSMKCKLWSRNGEISSHRGATASVWILNAWVWRLVRCESVLHVTFISVGCYYYFQRFIHACGWRCVVIDSLTSFKHRGPWRWLLWCCCASDVSSSLFLCPAPNQTGLLTAATAQAAGTHKGDCFFITILFFF